MFRGTRPRSSSTDPLPSQIGKRNTAETNRSPIFDNPAAPRTIRRRAGLCGARSLPFDVLQPRHPLAARLEQVACGGERSPTSGARSSTRAPGPSERGNDFAVDRPALSGRRSTSYPRTQTPSFSLLLFDDDLRFFAGSTARRSFPAGAGRSGASASRRASRAVLTRLGVLLRHARTQRRGRPRPARHRPSSLPPARSASRTGGDPFAP